MARAFAAIFKNTIVILTSNAGTEQHRQGQVSFTPAFQGRQARQASALADLRSRILPAVKAHFRPELLNRFDEIVVFHPLTQEHLKEIVEIMIARTGQRIAAQSITLRVTEPARRLHVEQGYDPAYGARPLRRAVQRLLDDLLAESLLRGDIKAGDTVVVDAIEGRLAAKVAAISRGQAA